MIPKDSDMVDESLNEALHHLSQCVSKGKCWACGCFRSTLDAIDPCLKGDVPEELRRLLRDARERVQPEQYDCLGCEACHPPIALNALERAGLVESPAGAICCTEQPVEERSGWPPLPGKYRVLRYGAPIAVCTLTDEDLARMIAQEAPQGVSIVGALQTENLGIERVIRNTVANPSLRFVVLCGADSKHAVGHLPGQSLLALVANGVDGNQTIVRAPGKRPVLANVSREAVKHFRQNVEVVDRIGTADIEAILSTVEACAARDPGPTDAFAPEQTIEPIQGYGPEKAVLDPAGFFVVYVDHRRTRLCLEHYRNDGVLNAVVEGERAPEVYYPALDKGFVTRLDHAAYLGRELARAEHALRGGEEYVQDAAPERPTPDPEAPCDQGCACETTST